MNETTFFGTPAKRLDYSANGASMTSNFLTPGMLMGRVLQGFEKEGRRVLEDCYAILDLVSGKGIRDEAGMRHRLERCRLELTRKNPNLESPGSLYLVLNLLNTILFDKERAVVGSFHPTADLVSLLLGVASCNQHDSKNLLIDEALDSLERWHLVLDLHFTSVEQQATAVHWDTSRLQRCFFSHWKSCFETRLGVTSHMGSLMLAKRFFSTWKSRYLHKQRPKESPILQPSILHPIEESLESLQQTLQTVSADYASLASPVQLTRPYPPHASPSKELTPQWEGTNRLSLSLLDDLKRLLKNTGGMGGTPSSAPLSSSSFISPPVLNVSAADASLRLLRAEVESERVLKQKWLRRWFVFWRSRWGRAERKRTEKTDEIQSWLTAKMFNIWRDRLAVKMDEQRNIEAFVKKSAYRRWRKRYLERETAGTLRAQQLSRRAFYNWIAEYKIQCLLHKTRRATEHTLKQTIFSEWKAVFHRETKTARRTLQTFMKTWQAELACKDFVKRKLVNIVWVQWRDATVAKNFFMRRTLRTVFETWKAVCFRKVVLSRKSWEAWRNKARERRGTRLADSFFTEGVLTKVFTGWWRLTQNTFHDETTADEFYLTRNDSWKRVYFSKWRDALWTKDASHDAEYFRRFWTKKKLFSEWKTLITPPHLYDLMDAHDYSSLSRLFSAWKQAYNLSVVTPQLQVSLKRKFLLAWKRQHLFKVMHKVANDLRDSKDRRLRCVLFNRWKLKAARLERLQRRIAVKQNNFMLQRRALRTWVRAKESRDARGNKERPDHRQNVSLLSEKSTIGGLSRKSPAAKPPRFWGKPDSSFHSSS